MHHTASLRVVTPGPPKAPAKPSGCQADCGMIARCEPCIRHNQRRQAIGNGPAALTIIRKAA